MVGLEVGVVDPLVALAALLDGVHEPAGVIRLHDPVRGVAVGAHGRSPLVGAPSVDQGRPVGRALVGLQHAGVTATAGVGDVPPVHRGPRRIGRQDVVRAVAVVARRRDHEPRVGERAAVDGLVIPFHGDASLGLLRRHEVRSDHARIRVTTGAQGGDVQGMGRGPAVFGTEDPVLPVARDAVGRIAHLRDVRGVDRSFPLPTRLLVARLASDRHPLGPVRVAPSLAGVAVRATQGRVSGVLEDRVRDQKGRLTLRRRGLAVQKLRVPVTALAVDELPIAGLGWGVPRREDSGRQRETHDEDRGQPGHRSPAATHTHALRHRETGGSSGPVRG